MKFIRYIHVGVAFFLFGIANCAFAQSEVDRCATYLNAGDYVRAVQAGQNAVRQSPRNGDAHFCLGDAFRLRGELTSALQELREAERLSSTKADLRVVYNRLGLTYSDIGDLDNAEFYHSRALSLATELGKKDVEASELNNLAVVFQDRGNLEKALEYYKQSLNLKRNESEQATVYNNIAVVYDQKGDHSSAIEYFSRAIGIHERSGNYASAATTRLNLGNTYRKIKEYDKARLELEQGLIGAKKAGKKYWEAVAYQYQAYLAVDTNHISDARTLLLMARQLAQSTGARGLIDSISLDYLAVEKIEKTRYFAGIEVGAKGIKAIVISVAPDPKKGLELEVAFQKSINTNLIAGVDPNGKYRPEAIEAAAQAVKELFETARTEHKISAKDIHIVASSAILINDELAGRVRALTGP